MSDHPAIQPSCSFENPSTGTDDFMKEVNSAPVGILNEYMAFLRHNKKWWLTPILLALFVAGAAVITSGSAAAPFIYALF